jgi:hypothetical protein
MEGRMRLLHYLADRSPTTTQSPFARNAVVVDATQYGPPDAEFTFETPFVPRVLMNFTVGIFITSMTRPVHRSDGSTRERLQSYRRSQLSNLEFGHSEFLIGRRLFLLLRDWKLNGQKPDCGPNG